MIALQISYIETPLQSVIKPLPVDEILFNSNSKNKCIAEIKAVPESQGES